MILLSDAWFEWRLRVLAGGRGEVGEAWPARGAGEGRLALPRSGAAWEGREGEVLRGRCLRQGPRLRSLSIPLRIVHHKHSLHAAPECRIVALFQDEAEEVYEDDEEFDEWNEEGEEEQEGGGGPMGGMQGGYPQDYQRAILEEMMRHQAQMARQQNELMSQLGALISQVPSQKHTTREHKARNPEPENTRPSS